LELDCGFASTQKLQFLHQFRCNSLSLLGKIKNTSLQKSFASCADGSAMGGHPSSQLGTAWRFEGKRERATHLGEVDRFRPAFGEIRLCGVVDPAGFAAFVTIDL